MVVLSSRNASLTTFFQSGTFSPISLNILFSLSNAFGSSGFILIVSMASLISANFLSYPALTLSSCLTANPPKATVEPFTSLIAPLILFTVFKKAVADDSTFPKVRCIPPADVSNAIFKSSMSADNPVCCLISLASSSFMFP